MKKKQIKNNSKYPLQNLSTNKKNSIPGLILKEINKDYIPTKGTHQHSFWEFFAIEKGTGTHHIDFQSHPIQKDSLFIIRPNQLHQINASSSIKGTVVMIETDFMLNCFPNLSTDPLLSITGPPTFYLTNTIKIYLNLIKEMILSEYIHKVELISTNIKNIILLCDNQKTNPKKKNYPPIVHEFLNTIGSHSRNYHLVCKIARKLNISTNYCNEIVKKHTQKTAKQWIQEQIILEAKKKLIHHHLSIKEIAYHCGFTDISNFYRFFKKQTKKTPSQYKIDMLKKINN